MRLSVGGVIMSDFDFSLSFFLFVLYKHLICSIEETKIQL